MREEVIFVGKIVVIGRDGKPAKNEEQIFQILRAALVPGIQQMENRLLISIFDEIKNHHRLSRKHGRDVNFYRSVKLNELRSLVIVFNYKPSSEECIAQCQIFRSGINSDPEKLFHGLFLAKSPNVTQLLVAVLDAPGHWLPELIAFS